MILLKDGMIKDIGKTSKCYERLLKEGWLEEGAEPSEADIQTIRTQLDDLSIRYHHKAGIDKLKELLPK